MVAVIRRANFGNILYSFGKRTELENEVGGCHYSNMCDERG